MIDEVKARVRERKLKVKVSSGDLSAAGRFGQLTCRGTSNIFGMYNASGFEMVFDENAIRQRVSARHGTRKQTEYMHLFGEVLLHEYKHAWDCVMGHFPVTKDKIRLAAMEFSVNRWAQGRYQALFEARAPTYQTYNYADDADDGNPECI